MHAVQMQTATFAKMIKNVKDLIANDDLQLGL
jgi:hypothetical protein